MFIEYYFSKTRYLLSIKYIDKENAKLCYFFNLPIYGIDGLFFENFLPIEPNSEYDIFDISGRDVCNEEKDSRFNNAYIIKYVLTKLMLERDLSEENKNLFLVAYTSLFFRQGTVNTNDAKNPEEDFCREIASDIFLTMQQNFYISKEKIIEIVNNASKTCNDKFDLSNVDLQEKLLSTSITYSRFSSSLNQQLDFYLPLKNLVFNMSALLKEAITALLFARSSLRNNYFLRLFHGLTPTQMSQITPLSSCCIPSKSFAGQAKIDT